MAADELGSRVNNDISAVLNRTDEVRGTESVVDYERQTVLVRNLCDSLDIRNIGIRVAESLDVNRLSIVLDSAFQFFQIVCINEGGLNAELRQSMCQQVVAAAVDGLLCYDVVAGLSKCLNGVGNRCGAGSGSQSGNTALECCNAWNWSDDRRYCLRQPDRNGQPRAGCHGKRKKWSGRSELHGNR